MLLEQLVQRDPELYLWVGSPVRRLQLKTFPPCSCIEAPPQTPMPRRTCTVVGPAVLDVHGQMRLVEDRCSYALLSAPDLQIVATFQERRRKDVGFLDGVILQLGRSDVHVSLDPGGRIRVSRPLLTREGAVDPCHSWFLRSVTQLNNLTMVLNGSAQRVYGVEVSKDRTGVTVQVSRSNLTASVFFNGDSVQLHLEGNRGKAAKLAKINQSDEEESSNYSKKIKNWRISPVLDLLDNLVVIWFE